MPSVVTLPSVVSLCCALLAGSAAAAHAQGPSPHPPGHLVQVEGAPAAPALDLDALDGAPAGLAEGRPSVVHFFATWCEPCRTELPALARFAARRPDVAVLLVDVAEPDDRIRRFLARDAFAGLPVPGPVLLDRDRAAARRWSVSLLPASFVVSGGRLRLALEGEVDWDAPATDAAVSALARSAVPIQSREDK